MNIVLTSLNVQVYTKCFSEVVPGCYYLLFNLETKCITPETGLQGSNLADAVIIVDNILQCIGSCMQEPLCLNWVFESSAKKCFRKGANVIVVMNKLTRSMGTLRCSCFENNIGVDPTSAEQLDNSFTVEDPGDCQTKCALQVGCDYFTVDTNNGDCVHWKRKAGMDFLNRLSYGVIFGPAVCD